MTDAIAPRFAAQVLLAAGATADAGARAQQAFAALGFTPGALVGGSFAIEADATAFAAVFGVRLRARSDGGVAVQGAPRRTAVGELPVTALPASLQPLVAHVLFTEPPAFGPGGGFGAGT